MKYFFLSDGWTVGRVWEPSGLWDDLTWRRKPYIQQLDICILEQNETLWLYQVEDVVLMVEVQPTTITGVNKPIGQVVLKRLMTAEQAIAKLNEAEAVLKNTDHHQHKNTL